MHIAHFIQRYPPALGGSEAYFFRLASYLQQRGHIIQTWTTTAIELTELWQPVAREGQPVARDGQPVARDGQPVARDGQAVARDDQPVARDDQPVARDGQSVARDSLVRRFQPLRVPLRRFILKGLSQALWPWPAGQLLTQPSSPICPAMWRETGRYSGPLDAVHATAFPYGFPLMCALHLARRRRVPLLLTPFLHLGDPTCAFDRTRRQYTTRALRWLLRQADAVFVQTQSERDQVLALGVPGDRAFLQGLGVEAAECTGGDRQLVRQRWGVVEHDVVVGHLANLSEEKGSADLLRALARLQQRGVPCRAVLAGPQMPNFLAFVRKEAARPPLLLGRLSEQEKRDFYAGIDLFALPSRTDSFGLVLLEAWANGKPVVVYRAGGPADLIRHGVDGLQARCGDLEDLAVQLQVLIESPELRGQLGRAGQLRSAHEFRWADRLAVVEQVLKALVRPTAPVE